MTFLQSKSDMLQTEDKLGAVLVQVQDELLQLQTNLAKFSGSEASKTVDTQALSDAIQRTKMCMRKHAEEYFRIRYRQLRVLPVIEELKSNKVQIPRWKPSLERITHLHPHKEDHPGAPSGKKPILPYKMHSRSYPSYPKNKTTAHKKMVTSLPDIYQRNRAATKYTGRTRGPMLSHHATKAKGCRMSVIPRQEDDGIEKHPSLVNVLMHHGAAFLHPKKDVSSKMGLKTRGLPRLTPEPSPESTGVGIGSDKHEPTMATPPPSRASDTMEHRDAERDMDSPQNLPSASDMTRYSFTVIKGHIDPRAKDFLRFKESFNLCWSNVVGALEALKSLLRDFAVPSAKVNGELLLEFSHGWEDGWGSSRRAMPLLCVLDNWEAVVDLVSRPGQRFKGEGGAEAAATHIQACWRRHVARTAYVWHYRRKWAAGVFAIAWVMRTRLRRVRTALQVRHRKALENNRRRAEHLAANWKYIQSSKRTIIHIPSLGYSRSQRQKMTDLDILQNTQIGRVCDIRDENVEVIYICSQHLGEDILRYYISLLECDGVADGVEIKPAHAFPSPRRFFILTPEAVDFFPTHNMCLSTLLMYSPRTLKRLRSMTQGKLAYIVGGVTHADDFLVADDLGVPILGPELHIAKLHSTQSAGRKILVGAGLDVPPGQGNINSLNQLNNTLAKLMLKHLTVQRWLFKIDSLHGACGTAYCDVCHLSCYTWALRKWYKPGKWNTESTQKQLLERYLDDIPQWLDRYARFARASSYPNWACFLKAFLRQGGVVEAYPSSDSVTCLTVDLLLHPGGQVTMLSCGDQLHGSSQLENFGSTVPQASLDPDLLYSICMSVGQACLRRHLIGHVSLDLATFLDFKTNEQKVWGIDLDIRYSDQLAMTQMLLMITRGTLDFYKSSLDVSMAISEKSCKNKVGAKIPTNRRYAVIGSHLFHSNLSMLYYNIFLKKCQLHGIQYNLKKNQGTAFALYDTRRRCSIGLIAVSEDLQGALVTFARNLSAIHQEISSCKTQGETNFKDVIRHVEDVLMIIAENKKEREDKPAARNFKE